MRRIAFLCCAALLAGCTTNDDTAADSPIAVADSPAAAVGPGGDITLAQVAGRWNMSNRGESGHSVLLTYVMDARAEPAGWTFTFPNREPIAYTSVTTSADSIVTVAGPFDSELRKGLKVTSTTVLRLQGDKLVGMTHARYQTSGPDTLRHFRVDGTRMP